MLPNLDDIIWAFQKHTYKTSDHALKRMIRRNIAPFRLEDAIGDDKPEIIESTPFDIRGPCCLVLGYTKTQQPLHARIGYGPGVCILITVYDSRTISEKWLPDWKTRK